MSAASPATNQPRHSTSLSTAALGWLSLVPVLVVVLAQLLHVGYSMTVASAVPVSDSNVWASCASALADSSMSDNLQWCLRRPLTVIAQSPLFVIAPGSMAAVVVLQVLVVSLLLWWFLATVNRLLPVRRWTVLLVYVLALWPVLTYGTYLGPEAPALALSFASAAALLRFLSQGQVWWGIASGVAAILALQMRPGNPVLTGVICGGVVVLTWLGARRILPALGIVAVFGLLWWLPVRLLGLLGWPQAGHASNFWSVMYSAATPDPNDTWIAAYDKFGGQLGCPSVFTPDPCLAFESQAFGELLQQDVIRLVQEYPTAIPRQLLSNITTLVSDGFLNHMWATPFVPAWRPGGIEMLASGWNGLGVVLATLLWLASLALVALLAVGLFRLRARTDSDSRLLRFVLWIGAVTIAGSALFFALVGHDEPQRHLVQNVPYVLLTISGVAAVFAGRARAIGGVRNSTRGSARWLMAVLVIIVVGAVTSAAIEGRASRQSFMVVRSCDEPASAALPYDVMSAASVGSRATVLAPSNWRTLESRSATVLLADISWVQQELDKLPAGLVLDLRSPANGEVVPVFVSDELLLAAQQTTTPTVWCTNSPSQYGTMLVHDLLPLN